MQFSWENVMLITRLVADILLVWTLIYAGIQIMRSNSRTYQIIKGLLAVVAVKIIASVLRLNAVNDLLNIFLNWGVIFVLVILQPEIRSMLEKVGKTSPEKRVSSNDYTPQKVDALVTAITDMSKNKTGALITLEMKASLEDYADTGVEMDCDISREVLETIFQYGTPLHDGAVIIKDGRIECAAAYFPPTNQDLPSRYGARHRAAVGISEITDSLTLVVSEETGGISVAQRGSLTPYNPEQLKRLLINRLIPAEQAKSGSFFSQGSSAFKSFTNSFNRPHRLNEPYVQQKVDDRVEPVEVKDLRPEDPAKANDKGKVKAIEEKSSKEHNQNDTQTSKDGLTEQDSQIKGSPADKEGQA